MSSKLWVHVLALLGLVTIIGVIEDRPMAGYTSDEGTYILQARNLISSGHWARYDPLSVVEPLGKYLVHGVNGPFYTTHPFYPLLLAAIGRVTGEYGYVYLSILGLVGASVAGALIARCLSPSLSIPVLWIVGIGTPLFFDGFTVVGHAIGAAAAGFATVAALSLLTPGLRRPSRAKTAADGLAITAAVLIASFVRGEGLLFSLALGFALLAAAVAHREARARCIGLGSLVIGAAMLSRLAETLMLRLLFGAGALAEGNPSAATGSSGLQGRAHALLQNLVAPTFSTSDPRRIDLVVGCGALFAAAYLARRSVWPLAIAIVGAVAVSAYALALSPLALDPVPGLLVACPFVIAGLISVRRRDVLATPETLVLTLTSILFTGAVILFSTVAGFQWGGRYFALELPVLVPLLALALARLELPQLRPLAITIVMSALVMTYFSAVTLRSLRAENRAIAATIRRCAAIAGPAAPELGLRKPLVIAPGPVIPLTEFPDYDSVDWMAGGPLREHAGRIVTESILSDLSNHHVTNMVLFTDGEPFASPFYTVQTQCTGAFHVLTVLRARGQ